MGRGGKDLGRGSFEELLGFTAGPGRGLEASDCAYSKGDRTHLGFLKNPNISLFPNSWYRWRVLIV